MTVGGEGHIGNPRDIGGLRDRFLGGLESLGVGVGRAVLESEQHLYRSECTWAHRDGCGIYAPSDLV